MNSTIGEMMHSRTRIKVCGITNIDDAREAIKAGADALGFIFVESSPRYISPEKTKEIVAQLPPFVQYVGVFVNEDPVEVEEIIEYCGLSCVQLHGSEDAEYCRELSHAATPCVVIKAFRIDARAIAADFQPYAESVKGFLLDTYAEGQEGGTGKTFDWAIIKSLNLKLPIILAGGLNPENAAEAVRAVRPFAIDINSGIEEQPGKKDYAKLHSLVTSVILADSL
jgi:phosphoribosylanthranilate isomerase